MRLPILLTSAVLAALVAAPQFASAQDRRERSGEARAQRWPSRGENPGSGQRQAEGPRAAAPRQEQPQQAAPPPQARGDNQRSRDDRSAGDQFMAQRQGRERAGGNRDGGNRGDSGVRNGGNREGGNRDGGVRNGGNRDDGRYAVRRNGQAPRYRDGDRRVYVQPRRNYYAYRYPGSRFGSAYPYGYYGYSYFDPGYRGDFFWGTGGWQSRYYYGGNYYSNGYNYDLGKLRLQIRQRDAEVYIDGYYAGVVDDFDGRLQGLQLEDGNYSVEIAAPGYEPLNFDVRVTAGRTTTYRGELLPE